VTEYEQYALMTPKDGKHLHHKQHPSAQHAFQKEVQSLVVVFEEHGNPFLEKGQDLLVLSTRDIVDGSVGETVLEVETIGANQFAKFVKEQLTSCEKAITEPISKNKLALFSNPSVKSHPTKQKIQLMSIKNDCNLFSRLYISCQTRDGDLDTFFAHENQSIPPSLSAYGKLRQSAKSDLLHCLELEEKQLLHAPNVDAIFLDGAAVVQMLNPGGAKTFQEYSDVVFTPYLLSQLQKANRIDIDWDVYILDSLKAMNREEKRGKGVRRRVSAQIYLQSGRISYI